MNAEEARLLTKKSIKKKVDEHLIAHVINKIKIDALAGRSQTVHPLDGLTGGYPSSDEQSLLWSELTKKGFKVIHHDDPDPGHPCSSPYTTIDW